MNTGTALHYIIKKIPVFFQVLLHWFQQIYKGSQEDYAHSVCSNGNTEERLILIAEIKTK